MSFLDPANAQTHYDKLKEAAQKLPANPEVLDLKNLIDSLAPFVGQSAPELEAALPSYIAAQKAILENNTAPTESANKRRQTPISKALSAVCAHSNALLSFCPEEGDAVIDDILKQVVVVSAVLKA